MMYIRMFHLMSALLACAITCDAVVADENLASDARPPYRVLFLGDSITRHGPAPQLKWTITAGMAASASENDYVHRLIRSLTEAMPDHRIEYAYGEGGGSVEGKLQQIDKHRRYQPHLVVVQLGEHEHPDKGIEVLEASYTALLEGLLAIDSKPQVIATGRWSPNNGKPYDGWIKQTDESMRRIAEAHDVPFVSIEDAAIDPQNSGYGEVSGVRWHPNDRGMEQYATRIFAAWQRLNPSTSPNAKTQSDRTGPLRSFAVSNLRTLTNALFADPIGLCANSISRYADSMAMYTDADWLTPCLPRHVSSKS